MNGKLLEDDNKNRRFNKALHLLPAGKVSSNKPTLTKPSTVFVSEHIMSDAQGERKRAKSSERSDVSTRAIRDYESNRWMRQCEPLCRNFTFKIFFLDVSCNTN